MRRLSPSWAITIQVLTKIFVSTCWPFTIALAVSFLNPDIRQPLSFCGLSRSQKTIGPREKPGLLNPSKYHTTATTLTSLQSDPGRAVALSLPQATIYRFPPYSYLTPFRSDGCY